MKYATIHAITRRAGALALGLCGVAALAGCQVKTEVKATVGPAEPAQRAATSFVHCVESEGGNCVQNNPLLGSWDAFALLHWLGSGSPTSILQALRGELEHHRNPYAIQDRLVAHAAGYREPLRGAECRPESAAAMSTLLPKLRSRVEGRLDELGLWRGDLGGVIDGLTKEAIDGLGEGWLVHMTCYGDPYEIWVATAKEGDRQTVVGFLTDLPTWLEGSELSDEAVEGRLENRGLGASTTLGVVREGTVDTNWMPIPIEEF